MDSRVTLASSRRTTMIIGNGPTRSKFSESVPGDRAEDRLPNAPSMKIYCLYGYGKETERSYWYMQGEYEQDESRSDAVDESGFVSTPDWVRLMMVRRQ
jgi:hypothetical protein